MTTESTDRTVRARRELWVLLALPLLFAGCSKSSHQASESELAPEEAALAASPDASAPADGATVPASASALQPSPSVTPGADTAAASKAAPDQAGMTDAEKELLGEGSKGFKPKYVKFPFYVYQDAGVSSFYPDGWMGDFKDVSLDTFYTTNPHSGKTCIKVEYRAGATLNCKWAGVYWLYPGNQWGRKQAGFDLTGAKKLTFWARGEVGGEVIQEFKMGGVSGKFRDSDTAGIGPVVLTPEWQQYEVPLEGVNLSYISGGFCWSTNLDRNRNGCTFYLDDIAYE